MVTIASCRKSKKASCFALRLRNIESYTDQRFHCFEYEIDKINNCGPINGYEDQQCPQNYGCDDSFTRSISSYNARSNKQRENKQCTSQQPQSHHHRRRRNKNNKKDGKFDNHIVIGIDITECPDLSVQSVYDLINDATTCGPLTIEPMEGKDDIIGIGFDFKGDSLKFNLCLNDINHTNPGYVQFMECGKESRPSCIYDLLPDLCGMYYFLDVKTKLEELKYMNLTISKIQKIF